MSLPHNAKVGALTLPSSTMTIRNRAGLLCLDRKSDK